MRYPPSNGCADFRKLTRRNILRLGILAPLGLTLPQYLRLAASAEGAQAKTTSAILIFLGGGLSHHDSFDPKPNAPAEIRGELSTIASRVPGIQLSNQLPLLADQMHHLALLRAVTHRDGAHEPGVAYLSTGYPFRPGHNYPGIGAVVAHERQGGSRGNGLPLYVGIPEGRGGGYLGPAFNPFSIPGDPNAANFRVQDLTPPDGLSAERLLKRRRLAEQVSEDFRKDHPADVQTAVDRFTQQAYEMTTSPRAQAAFDLTRENDKTRTRYGKTQLGQRLLLARRLVEAGVPFVTATDFGWDDHQGIFPKLKQKLPVVDQGLSALVADLDERGLLARTLVIVMGEFGRTPKINTMQGRDHWPNAFSVLLAGGGVSGGQAIGASDKDGAFPKDRPVTPEELIHSLYVLLGIDPTRFLPSLSGREIQIVREGKFIKELTQ